MIKNTETKTNENIDLHELAKFEAVAEQWWDRTSEFKPLHDINPLRVNFIDEFAGIAEKTIIDVGCGGGILSESMAHRGAKVTGIDMGEGPLAVAKIHLQQSDLEIEYLKITAEEIAQQRAEQYDVVCCLEMLEHVPDPSSIIQSCFKLLKPGGHVFFSTINRNLKSYAMAIIGAEYILRLLPKGTHDYDKLIKPSELSKAARDAGLIMKNIVGLSYNPITQSYKLGKNVDVNYMIHCQRPEAE